MISLKKIMQEAFGDYYRKNTWIELPRHVVASNADELFDLVQNAYADKGGNLKIKSRNDIMDRTEINYWLAIDTDTDPEPDAAIGGKSTPAGTKISVMGQDGGKDAKRSVIQRMIAAMKTRGFYAEIDMDLANKFGLKPITNKTIINKVLAGKEIEHLGKGLYKRTIGAAGKAKEKVLVGIPKV
jgi:hypothetical protein